MFWVKQRKKKIVEAKESRAEWQSVPCAWVWWSKFFVNDLKRIEWDGIGESACEPSGKFWMILCQSAPLPRVGYWCCILRATLVINLNGFLKRRIRTLKKCKSVNYFLILKDLNSIHSPFCSYRSTTQIQFSIMSNQRVCLQFIVFSNLKFIL